MTDQPVDLGDTPAERVKALMARLRCDCPWDSTQSFETIAPYTIEEAYEVADAIERKDMDALRDELGDLLFQVLFHSILASEVEAFDFDDVCNGLVEKMVRRHPHIFGPDGTPQPDWEDIKAAERGGAVDDRTLSGVALSLPALMRAQKLSNRAAKTGFDWPDTDGVFAKIDEELIEVKDAIKDGVPSEIESEIGDLLFAVVNLARKNGVDAEIALRGANAKFTRRFEHVEDQAGDKMQTLSLDELEAFWGEAKKLGL